MALLFLLPVMGFGQFMPIERGSFTDQRDGKEYPWVKIGDQVWMAENLAYQPFGQGSFSYDYKDDYEEVYGRLYTWEVALDACPAGWRLPEANDFTVLYSRFGRMKSSGGALKEKGNELWKVPNMGATNVSGFSARPGGSYSGKLYLDFNGIGKQAYFWTSTEVGESSARILQLGHNHNAAYDLNYPSKEWALSVRCIRGD